MNRNNVFDIEPEMTLKLAHVWESIYEWITKEESIVNMRDF
jgi:hypothetical protein